MKNSLACPKCDSRRLWRIENFATDDEVVGGRTMRVAVNRLGVSTFWRGADSAGLFDAYVCDRCGYTEFWAHDYERLEHLPDHGIHLIDTTPERGQFR
jgi:predicted nucleic-acid-binding Zn-ribbon protein